LSQAPKRFGKAQNHISLRKHISVI